MSGRKRGRVGQGSGVGSGGAGAGFGGPEGEGDTIATGNRSAVGGDRYGAPDEAVVAALCSSSVATTARVRALLDRFPPVAALDTLRTHPGVVVDALTDAGCRLSRATVDQWAAEATAVPLVDITAKLRARDEKVWWRNKATEPSDAVLAQLFADDDDGPPVLFWQGDTLALERPRVAIVGTRNATTAGREMARLLGRELSDRGVSVVSGLALGIDAAAHAGALASLLGSPVGVVGSGLGIVYPPANRRLWEEVASRGLLISELAYDRGPTPSTFPARNRIIAQLAQVVVVVESGHSGGSLITVDRAEERGREILAVPGNPLSPMSSGTNDLLRPNNLLGARAKPCLGVADVLTLLDVEVVSSPGYVDDRLQPSEADETVLLALGWDDLSVGAIANRLAAEAASGPPSLGELALALARLESQGWVTRAAGRWRRVGVTR